MLAAAGSVVMFVKLLTEVLLELLLLDALTGVVTFVVVEFVTLVPLFVIVVFVVAYWANAETNKRAKRDTVKNVELIRGRRLKKLKVYKERIRDFVFETSFL